MKTNILEKFRRKIFRLNQKQINEMSDEARRKNVIDDHTPFIISEAYRTARTNIMFASAGNEGGKIILLTSALPNEGKTTSVINLAITFAQAGMKILLIDADMRKPRVHRYLSIDKKNGLSDLLSGFKTEDEVIHRDIRSNFDVITSGQLPPNPAELLSLNITKTYMDKFAEEYDYVFIDTPPVDVVTDAVSLSKYSTGVICVVRANQALVGDVKSMIESLNFAKAKILGFILNGSVSAFNKKMGYRYKYSGIYKYNYHYSYGDIEEKKRQSAQKSELSAEMRHSDHVKSHSKGLLPNKTHENSENEKNSLKADSCENTENINNSLHNDIAADDVMTDIFKNTVMADVFDEDVADRDCCAPKQENN